MAPVLAMKWGCVRCGSCCGCGGEQLLLLIVTNSASMLFEHALFPIIGINFLSKRVFLKNHTIHLSTRDTAKEPRFCPLVPSYMQDSEVAVVVYYVKNQTSFLNMAMWVDLIRMQCRNDILIVLVKNKADLLNRQVGTNEGKKQAKIDGLLFMECSSKSGGNVQG
eukprot:15365180-Ditylum_brightwellii.AAC.1